MKKRIDFRIYRKAVPFIFCVLLSSFSFSQINVSVNEMQNKSSLNGEKLDLAIENIQLALEDYNQKAKLIDKEKKRVTRNSTKAFRELFAIGAKIIPDYEQYIDGTIKMNPEDYAQEIREHLVTKGLKFKLSNASIQKIEPYIDESFVKVHVLLNKTIFNSLDKNRKEVLSVEGKTYSEKIIYNYNLATGEAKIININPGVEIKVAEQYTNRFSLAPAIGTSFCSPQMSDFWNNSQDAGNLNVNGGLNYSIAFEFMTDKWITPVTSSDRKLAMSLGLRYSSFFYKSELSQMSIGMFTTQEDIPNGLYATERLAYSVDGVEETRVNALEIPVGLAFNLAKSKSNSFYIHARLNPIFVLSGKTSFNDGMAIYDNVFYTDDTYTQLSNYSIHNRDDNNNTDPSVYQDAGGNLFDYQSGEQAIGSIETEPLLKSMALSAMISPTAYIKLSDYDEGWGLIAAIDFTLQFSSLFEHNPVMENQQHALKTTNDLNRSLINYYTSDLSTSNLAFRIGLYRYIKIDP